ncbi:MAG: hypothetical protein ACQERN_01945 [Thermodesulfobacteriota bacterium]
MATTDDDGGIGAEVTSRLDELFGEEDSPESQGAANSGKQAESAGSGKKSIEKSAGADEAAEDSPVKDLKALVFGIEWEITDASMVSYLKEVKRLQQQYQNDKILSMFLKLHESIGKYIKAKKARAHPDAIKFVTSVFKNFEEVLLTPDMPESQQKRLLSGEVKKFKDFKQRVINQGKTAGPAPAETAEPEKPKAPAAEKATPAVSLESQEALDYIVEELKKTIKAEFQTMRQIIKNLGA